MNLRYFSLLIIFGYNLLVYSQNSDAQMEKILQERRDYNKTIAVFDGFKIQIFNGLSESQARQAQAKFTSSFSGIPVQFFYEQPDWKVQVGNYRYKEDAQSVLPAIRKKFPGALILKAKIKL